MDKLTALLEEHTDIIYVEGHGDMHCTSDLTHLAEMLKPLLAEVWDAGGTTAIEREHTYGQEEKAKYSNPYEKAAN